MCWIKLTNCPCSNTYMYIEICRVESTIHEITLWDTTDTIKYLLLNHPQHRAAYKCAISKEQVIEDVGEHSTCQSAGMRSEKADSTTHYYRWNGKEMDIDGRGRMVMYA